MKKICKNCGAKIPRNSDTCKKCGEHYEYIDFEIDDQTKELITVEKPSNMIHICLLILSIIIFIYSLVLVYLRFTNKEIVKEMPAAPDSSSVDSSSSEPEVNYFAADFIGQTFKEVKNKLGEQYSIKLSASSGQTQASYINYPIVLLSTDKTLTDDSIISSVIVTDNGSVTPQITADMTYSQLKSILNLSKPAPISDGTDEFFYVTNSVANDNYVLTAKFRFESEDTEKPCIAVIVSSDELTAAKNYGTVTGLDEGSSLNVRKEALYAAESLLQLHEGDKVEILDKVTTEDGALWYEVSFNNVKGYSSAEFIVPDQENTNTDSADATDSSETQISSESESDDQAVSEAQ